MERKPDNMSRNEALESLRQDFDEEEFKVLMNGVDAIVDVTNKFGLPYHAVQGKIMHDYQMGLVKESNGMIIGFEKREKPEENS